MLIQPLQTNVVINREEFIERTSGNRTPVGNNLMLFHAITKLWKKVEMTLLCNLNRQTIPHSKSAEAKYTAGALASTQSGTPLLRPRRDTGHRRSGCSSRGPRASKGYCFLSWIDGNSTNWVSQGQGEAAKLNSELFYGPRLTHPQARCCPSRVRNWTARAPISPEVFGPKSAIPLWRRKK